MRYFEELFLTIIGAERKKKNKFEGFERGNIINAIIDSDIIEGKRHFIRKNVNL